MPALHEFDATTLASLIRSREISSREVVEAHLARIDAHDGYLGAVPVVLRESALAEADRADRSAALGPLHGVPFTVKENLDLLGTATTQGIPALRHALPWDDAPAVSRLKAAGAIPIGRTNLSEQALRLCTSNPLHGRTFNPWDPRRTVGGSSGGDAAAVATGMTPLGLGGDMGGSLRIPAGCCGVLALKPTTGRIPHASSLPPQDLGLAGQLMLGVGPIARSVSDLRLVLSIAAGRDRRDPRSVDVPLLGPEPDERRAALVTRLPGGPLPAEMVAAIERAGALLQEAGWEVEEAAPPELERANEIFHLLLAEEFGAIAEQTRPHLSDALYEHLLRVHRSVRFREGALYRAWIDRSRLIRAWSGFFSEYPVVVGPNWGREVWPVDADLDPATGLETLLETVRFLTPGNVLGIPSVALPMGVVDGLPTGIQLYADLWREDLCMEAAAAIERGIKVPTPIDPIR